MKASLTLSLFFFIRRLNSASSAAVASYDELPFNRPRLILEPLLEWETLCCTSSSLCVNPCLGCSNEDAQAFCSNRLSIFK
mgnify:CR=1 FL=1